LCGLTPFCSKEFKADESEVIKLFNLMAVQLDPIFQPTETPRMNTRVQYPLKRTPLGLYNNISINQTNVLIFKYI
jgi:hypothetical protein